MEENINSQNSTPTCRQREPLSFGKTMLASAVGMIIASAVLGLFSFIISVIMIVSMIGSMSSGMDSDSNVVVKSNTFLHIDLTRQVQEASPGALETLFGEETVYGANDLLAALWSAKENKNVTGLYITCGGTSGLSWALSEELRNAIIDFRESGKPVIFYGETYSQSEYYIATAGDKIFLHTDGMVDFRGIGAQVMYYKDLFDKLGVKVDLIRPKTCAYKSAGETYTMNHMSDANREQIHAYINSIWNHVGQQMADSRNMSLDSLNGIADNLTGYLGKDAYRNGLVDSLVYAHDAKMITRDTYGRSHTLGMSKYIKKYVKGTSKSATKENKNIAVIYAEGNVLAGNDPGYGIGIYTDKMVKAIHDAATDDNVCAIVLRVNSPGGAANTSQSITDAVRKAKALKPVVVSMSDYAASAGYEMSCLANCIVAQPTTVTGSIGVFGTIPEVGSLLKNKIGITFDTACTNKNATGLSIVAPLSPTARNMMQRMVEDFYVTFVNTVAEGRHMTYEEVDNIARGRVWTGADALKIGLVDTLGGIDLAVSIAADLAKVKKYNTVCYPNQNDWMTQLQKMMKSDSGDDEDEFNFSIRQKALALAKARNAIRDNRSHNIEQRLRDDLISLSDEPTLQARLPYLLIEM